MNIAPGRVALARAEGVHPSATVHSAMKAKRAPQLGLRNPEGRSLGPGRLGFKLKMKSNGTPTSWTISPRSKMLANFVERLLANGMLLPLKIGVNEIGDCRHVAKQ